MNATIKSKTITFFKEKLFFIQIKKHFVKNLNSMVVNLLLQIDNQKYKLVL
jgi:hypothetical protein